MKKIMLTGLALAGLTWPASAQIVEYAECKTLAEYAPQAGVDYQPGVDVNGKPVVPADLNAAPFEMPDIMSIPLSVDLARRIPGGPRGLEADASIGFLEVHKSGRITYEGQDWTPQVYAICRGEAPPPLPLPGDGQDRAAPVELPPVVVPAPNSPERGGVKIQGGEGRKDRYN